MTGSEMNKLTVATMQVEALRKQLADAQATVEALQAQLEAANTLLYKKNCAIGKAETTIEALQRERDEAASDRDDWLTSWRVLQRHNERIEAALDAELEKVKRLENEVKAFQDIVRQAYTLQNEHTQLQALVRAYGEAKVAFDDGRLREDHHAWKERYERLTGAEQALITTLDATTPATKGGDGE